VFAGKFTLLLGDLGLVNEVTDDEFAILSCSGNLNFRAPEVQGRWGKKVVGSVKADVFSLCAMILFIIEHFFIETDDTHNQSFGS